MKANEEFLSWDKLQQELEELDRVLEANDQELIRDTLKKLVSGYLPHVYTKI